MPGAVTFEEGHVVAAGRFPSGIYAEAMRYSVENGGKRIRPMLTLEFCRMCGGSSVVVLNNLFCLLPYCRQKKAADPKT